MEWTEEIVARLRELWEQGLSTAEIGRQLNVTKNAVVGKAHRLGLEARPSPIRKVPATKPVTKKEKSVVQQELDPEILKEKAEKTATGKAKPKKGKEAEPVLEVKESEKASAVKEAKVESKPKKAKLDFSTPVEQTFQKRSNHAECCWPIGDPGVKGFHFCGAPAIPGKPYCLEHVQVAYVKLRDRKNSVA